MAKVGVQGSRNDYILFFTEWCCSILRAVSIAYPAVVFAFSFFS